jgi:protocadherin Fat 1/2/3
LGVPKLSTTCPVEIHLIDVEENQLPPRFTESVYETSIEENKPKNTEILTVKTIDNTPVYYELVDGDGLGYFLMDKESGILRTASVIDYEQNADFWLTVRAIHRNKKSPLFSYAHIYIRIIDLNDQRPLFSQPIYFPSVVENSEPNKVILRLNATDGDASIQNSALSPIKYTIERGNSQSNFMLDENTGYLVTGRRHLDRETQAQHELYIQACDQGQLCSSVLVVVTVSYFNV